MRRGIDRNGIMSSNVFDKQLQQLSQLRTSSPFGSGPKVAKPPEWQIRRRILKKLTARLRQSNILRETNRNGGLTLSRHGLEELARGLPKPKNAN